MARQRIGSRTPLACDECRRSKTKCSGTQPYCRRCTRRQTACTWPRSAQPPPLPGTPASSVSAQSPRTPREDSALARADHARTPYSEHLLGVFYTRHHDVEFCSFLHRPTTMAELHSQSPFLAAAVASLASIYDSDSDSDSDYTEQATVLGRAVSDQPSILSIQGFLVLAVRQLIAWHDRAAWMHAGTAIRMAQALQLDREDEEAKVYCTNKTSTTIKTNNTNKQREVRRRTFWACFVVDRLISYACHRRFSVDLAPFTSSSSCSSSLPTHLPCSENAFVFGEAGAGPAMHNVLAPIAPQPLSKLGMAPFYIAAVKLWGDMALLHATGGRRQMALRPTDPASPFAQASQAISLFTKELPPALHWSPANYALFRSLGAGPAASFVHLSLVLHHARCVMHHEYLPQLDMQYYAPLDGALYSSDEAMMLDAASLPPSYADKPTIDTCIHAINTITEIVDVVLSEDEDGGSAASLQSTVAGSALMTAAAVHLWIVYTQTCDRCPKHAARASFERLLGVIGSWEAQWPVAAAWSQTLGMLYKLYEFSYGTEPVPEFVSWEAQADGEADTFTGMNTGEDGPQAGQCLHDKVRGILAHPLHPPDVKRRNLRVFSQALWQNLWGSSLFSEIDYSLLNI